MTKPVYAGSSLSLSATFRDPISGAPSAVGGVSFHLLAPDGTAYALSENDLSNPSVGVFSTVFDVPADKPGLWQFRAESDSPYAGVVQESFMVVANNTVLP